MLKFISFGSGSSGNCYYLFTPTDGLVIDVGLGLRTLKKHFREPMMRETAFSALPAALIIRRLSPRIALSQLSI